MKKFFVLIMVFAFFSGMSCTTSTSSNSASGDKNDDLPVAAEKTYVSVSVKSIDSISRAITSSISHSDLSSLALSYRAAGSTGTFSELKTWASYAAIQNDSDIEIKAGRYEFRLSALAYGTSLSGTATVNVEEGKKNPLAFTIKVDSYSNSGSADVFLTINVANYGNAKSASMVLYKDDEAVSGTESSATNLSSFNYSKENVPVGNYVLAIIFKAEDGSEISAYRESFIVMNGINVSGVVEIADAGNLFSINYNPNGGEIKGSCVHSYTLLDAVTLPSSVERLYYIFDGWYTEPGFANKISGWLSGEKSGNISLYAKWTPENYSITYAGDFDSNPNAVNSYTVESETIVLSDAVKSGSLFDGWYSGSTKVTSIPTGSHGNIILTAKWKDSLNGFDVTIDTSCPVSMTKSGATFTVAGAKSCIWYVNGTMVSNSGNSYTVNFAASGTYTVNVLATAASDNLVYSLSGVYTK